MDFDLAAETESYSIARRRHVRRERTAPFVSKGPAAEKMPRMKRCPTTLLAAAAALLAASHAPRSHALRVRGWHGSSPPVGRLLPDGAAGLAFRSLRLRGGAEFMSSASLLAQNPEMTRSLMSSKYLSKTRKYGFMVLGLGVLLSALGFVFFFNGALIGTGNLLTIGGVVLIAGHDRAYAFLAQRERTRGSGIFLFGVFLVLRGWPRIGVLVSHVENLCCW